MSERYTRVAPKIGITPLFPPSLLSFEMFFAAHTVFLDEPFFFFHHHDATPSRKPQK